MILDSCPICKHKFAPPEAVGGTVSLAGVCHKCRKYACGVGYAMYSQSLLIGDKWVHEIWREAHTSEETKEADARFSEFLEQARTEYEKANS